MELGDLVRVRSTAVSIDWTPEQGYLGLIASPVRLGADAQYVNVQSVKTGVALWVRAYRLTPCDKTEGAK